MLIVYWRGDFPFLDVSVQDEENIHCLAVHYEKVCRVDNKEKETW